MCAQAAVFEPRFLSDAATLCGDDGEATRRAALGGHSAREGDHRAVIKWFSRR